MSLPQQKLKSLLEIIETYTFVIGLVPYGDGIIAERNRLNVEDVCAHPRKLGTAHHATLVRVDINARTVNEQKEPGNGQPVFNGLTYKTYILCN